MNVSYILLRNKLPPNFAAYNSKYLLYHRCNRWLNWLAWVRDSQKAASQLLVGAVGQRH